MSVTFSLYDESGWREELWSKLELSESASVDGLLSEEEIRLWKLRTLKWHDEFDRSCLKNCKFLLYEDVIGFINSCAKFIVDFLKSEGVLTTVI